MHHPLQIGMCQLDRRLSQVVALARTRPVAVHRYGSPWVWILSDALWRQCRHPLESYLPPVHPLRTLRESTDLNQWLAALSVHRHELHLSMPLQTALLCALLLELRQAESSEHLHDQLHCNLLWRWFCDLPLGPLPFGRQRMEQDLLRVRPVMGRQPFPVMLSEPFVAPVR